ncbi:tetratricopeptide repeat-containing sensor histidine kinase [Mucilaginibacter defluvii]|uniref:tetratricopeptide repeat-containing sensor histidine kinase n=1 Tax=Mucilaginibacter defluvii TaxID=1196019 RepID=UPI0031F16DBD
MLWLCFAALFIIWSCKPKQKKGDERFSPEFTKILKHGTALLENHKNEEGLRYIDSGFNTVASPTTGDYVRRHGLHYMVLRRGMGEIEKSLVYADSMVYYATRNKKDKYYAENLAEASFSKGDALFDLKRYDESYQQYYEAYLIGQNTLNRVMLSEFTYRMALIMFRQGNYELSKKYFKESYSQSYDNNEFLMFYRRQEVLDNIGLCYKKLYQNDTALYYFQKALKFINDNEPRFKKSIPQPVYRQQVTGDHFDIARGVVYGNIAEIYQRQGRYAEAADLLKKSIAINLRKGNDNNDGQLTEIKLAKLWLERNQIDSLKQILDDIRSQFDTLRNEEAVADWNNLMAQYYLRKRDFEKAANFLLVYDEKKDSLNKKLSDLIASDVTKQVASYESQRKIELLSSNNKVQRIYLVTAVVIGILLLSIIILVYRNWKRSRTAYQVVNNLNEQINEQNSVLAKALTELNINSREKDRILRTVAHDLRNPIGGIASLTTAMIDDAGLTHEQQDLINLIKDTSYNTLELINEIMEIANNNNAPLRMENVEINSLVSNSVELLRFKAAEKQQRIEMELLPNEKELYISREKIWRVISNLISNAIKFSQFGSIINVRVIEDTEGVRIAVNDRGIGIPDKLKSQIFNMFTDAKRPGTGGEKSFGLGLSICKQIVEKHNGRIWFESSAENGTTFYVKLLNTSSAA